MSVGYLDPPLRQLQKRAIGEYRERMPIPEGCCSAATSSNVREKFIEREVRPLPCG